MLPALIAGGAAVAGGLLQYHGQMQTNASNETIAGNATRANMEEAARNRQFQATSAKEQMEFQERMANTVHQRQVEDLKKAGLNPILAATGGAPSPSGSSASGSAGSAQSVKLDNPFQGASNWVSSALEAMQMTEQMTKTRAETRLINAQSGQVGKAPINPVGKDIYDWFKKKWKEAQRYKAPKTQSMPEKKGHSYNDYKLF